MTLVRSHDATVRDRVNRTIYRAAWTISPHIPRPILRRFSRFASQIAARRPGAFLRRWQRTVAQATGVYPDHLLTTEAVESYLRMLTEVWSLPGWGPEEIVATVSTDAQGERAMRAAITDRGVVLALPHMANWDLAGAWACTTGLPVSTVAEQLPPAEFSAFTQFRSELGMTVYSHTDPSAITHLIADTKAGQLVCLVSDRDLTRRGASVTWPGGSLSRPVTVPTGPAVVARATGALFMAIACHYTEHGMHISFSDPIEHRPGRDGIAAMMQEVTDFHAAAVIAHPADWHMFQPFFSDQD